MEDTNHNIQTNPRPAVLDIKPVEHLEKVVEVKRPEPPDEVMEDLKDDDIFIKPKTEVKKKKKQISERQRAHMKKMSEIRKQKAAERKAAKQAKEPKPPPKTEVRKPVDAIDSKPLFTGHQGTMSNQEYMKEFFSNMNMFMDSYNKLNTIKKPQSTPQNIPQKDHFNDMKPVKKKAPARKTLKQNTPNNNTDFSYSIDFLKPMAKNYKNPFGF